MRKLIPFIIIFCLNFGLGQLNRIVQMEDFQRNDGNLYAWVFFKDKNGDAENVQVSERTLNRRNKSDSGKNYNWYDTNPSIAYVNSIINLGAELRGKSRWFNAISIECNDEQLEQILLMPFVKEVQPLRQYWKSVPNYNNDIRKIGKLNSLNRINYGRSEAQLEQINVPKAHEAGYTGEGVKILVLDTGYNLDHPVFDSINVIAEWDVINDDSTTANEDGQDIGSQQNHGTGVLSIIGGYVQDSQDTLIGPAFNSKYILAKTEDDASETIVEEDYFVMGLEWGESLGADIVTTSVGYTNWYAPEDMDGNTALITKAYVKATQLGLLCIASAGNENYSWNNWKIITPPADADSILSVGAVNSEGTITGFSSRGPTADGRRKPEVCARGHNTYMAKGTTSYGTGDGTSFAAPLVAGAAALVMEAHPDWSAMAIREAIIETASQSNSPDNTYGWGIMDTWAAINYDGSKAFEPELEQNYPNPISDYTTIEYLLKQSAKVELIIYNILGNRVVTLVDNFEASGTKTVNWNGKDSRGKRVSNGVYFYSLIIGDTQVTNKLVVIN